MKIEMGKKYKTRAGDEVRLYACNCGGVWSVHGAYKIDEGWRSEVWKENGRYNERENNDNDLIEVPQWIQREYWVNVYEHGIGTGNRDKCDADANGGSRLACVKMIIDCEVGEGT